MKKKYVMKEGGSKPILCKEGGVSIKNYVRGVGVPVLGK